MPSRTTDRLPGADEQAEGFGRTRSDHRNEIAEDYVELIADLIDATGRGARGRPGQPAGRHQRHRQQHDRAPAARRPASIPSPIARSSSPARAATSLSTAGGGTLIVYRFLRSLGVSEEVARVDAEGIEHHVSDETLAAFDRLLRERDRNGEGG